MVGECKCDNSYKNPGLEIAHSHNILSNGTIWKKHYNQFIKDTQTNTKIQLKQSNQPIHPSEITAKL